MSGFEGSMSRRWLGLAFAIVLAWGIATPVAAQDAERRWDKEEGSYSQMNLAEKCGSNVRKGLTGLFDSVANAAFSVAAIGSPYSGHLVKKVAIFAGDVIGLVDDNPVTAHVFQGIVSRQFLRLGAGAAALPRVMGVIHDTTFDAPTMAFEDYVGPATFHTGAYSENSGLATLGAVVISDVLLRPAGSLITIFGFRAQGQELHDQGIELIGDALKVSFF